MSDENKWFLQGEEGFQRKQSIDQVTKLRKEKGVFRFWLKPDEEGTVVFLDSNPVYVYEHNIKVGKTWGNYFTCVNEIGNQFCPFCDRGDKPVYTAYFSIIDTRQWTRADGSVSKNRKILWPAKGSTIKKVHDLIKKHGDLRGKAFTIKRWSPNDPNCGTDFDFVKDVDLTKIEDTQPFDYQKILTPPTPEEYAAVGIHVSQPVVVGSEEDTKKDTTSGADDLF